MELADFGHHFLVEVEATSLSEKEQKDFQDLAPLGIVLIASNFDYSLSYLDWLKKLQTLIAACQKASGRDKLVVAIQEEGGQFHHTPAPLTHFPAPSESLSLASNVARALCTELESFGVNLLLGPVVDISSAQHNSMMSGRTFSDSTEQVVDAAMQFCREASKCNITPCPGHFPGQGAAIKLASDALSSVNISAAEITHRDLRPFAALVADGVQCLRASQVHFSALDRDFPAFMSKKIIGSILRDSFDFAGVLVSDRLEEGLLERYFPSSEIVKNAFCAGTDVFHCSNSYYACQLAQHLSDVATVRAASEAEFFQSAKRIDQLHESIKNSAFANLRPDILQHHQQIVSSAKKISI